MPLFLVPWRYDEQFAFYTDTKFRGSNPSSSVAEFFNLDFRQLQIEFLMQRIHLEYGDQPYLKESIERYLEDK